MPAGNNRKTKHYRVQAIAGAASLRAVPFAPGRVFLHIQNTGANPALVHFGESVQGDGSDLVVAALDTLPVYQQADTCPTEAINVQSTLGTTLVIIEGTVPT